MIRGFIHNKVLYLFHTYLAEYWWFWFGSVAIFVILAPYLECHSVYLSSAVQFVTRWFDRFMMSFICYFDIKLCFHENCSTEFLTKNQTHAANLMGNFNTIVICEYVIRLTHHRITNFFNLIHMIAVVFMLWNDRAWYLIIMDAGTNHFNWIKYMLFVAICKLENRIWLIFRNVFLLIIFFAAAGVFQVIREKKYVFQVI